MTPSPDWAGWRRAAVACLHDQPRDLPHAAFPPPPLDVGALVRELDAAGVHWVLDGSVVLVAAGVELSPGDLDVVPDLGEENLQRLAAVLEHLDAFPECVPGWEYSLTIDEIRRWRPNPAIEANLNHRFVTERGILDIVPRLTGTYRELLVGSWKTRIEGREVVVADVRPVLERLRRSKRDKDRRRWELARHLAK